MSNQVRVIDVLSKTILFETSLDKISDAYSFATQMEEAGLDIEIVAPGLAETLISALGANDKEISEFKQSLQDEIEEHDDSDFGCTVCPPAYNKGEQK
jgi:hypothetical protein